VVHDDGGTLAGVAQESGEAISMRLEALGDLIVRDGEGRIAGGYGYNMSAVGWIAFPFIGSASTRPDHFKPRARLAVPVRRGHAADGEQFFSAHPFGCHVKQFVAEVDALDQADDDAVAADLQRAPFHTLQAGGRFRDARRFHHRRRRCVQAGAGQFAFAERQRGGALVHRLGNGLVNEVHDEFMGGADVARGVLGRIVVAVAGGEGTDGRIGTQQVEEAERRGVHPAVGAEGRHQRDGPRRDQAGEDRIGALGEFVFEVEFHGGLESSVDGPLRQGDYRSWPELRRLRPPCCPT